MKRLGLFCLVVLLVAVCAGTSYATIVEFEFTDNYLVDNWKLVENLPDETFGIVLNSPDGYSFTTEGLSTNVPYWLTFEADNPGGTSLYFGYKGTGGNPFEMGHPISLTATEGYEFSFNLDPISPSFSPGDSIVFPVDLYFGTPMEHVSGTMTLTGIPEPATIALLGIGMLFLKRRSVSRERR